MKLPRGTTWKWLAAAALLAVLAALLGGGGLGATSSALSRGGGGWLAARLYLEARGATVELRDEPLTGEVREGVLVLAFPWQTGLAAGELEALGDHLRAGGTVVVAYSGDFLELRETQIFDALNLEAFEARPPPPLMPTRWWAYHRQSWLLTPGEGWHPSSFPTLATPAFRRAPAAPDGARVLYRGGDEDLPLVFDYPLHRGRVVALPSGLFANAWLRQAGNADFLETLLGWLGPEWSFDEYHHGLARGTSSAPASRFAWDLLMLHLAVIYLLGLAALGRRFGPAWREPPAAAGSTASFLRHLGALHHRLRHHRQAAALMVERARAFDPRLAIAAEPPEVTDGRGLVELGRTISQSQHRRQL